MVCEHVRLQIGVHKCALSSLVYEEEQLDGLLSPADLERLVPGAVAVPPEIRDLEGRWRHVLDALGVSRAVSVKDALELFDDAAQVGKTDEWCVRLMSSLSTRRLARPCSLSCVSASLTGAWPRRSLPAVRCSSSRTRKASRSGPRQASRRLLLPLCRRGCRRNPGVAPSGTDSEGCRYPGPGTECRGSAWADGPHRH